MVLPELAASHSQNLGAPSTTATEPSSRLMEADSRQIISTSRAAIIFGYPAHVKTVPTGCTADQGRSRSMLMLSASTGATSEGIADRFARALNRSLSQFYDTCRLTRSCKLAVVTRVRVQRFFAKGSQYSSKSSSSSGSSTSLPSICSSQTELATTLTDLS